MAVFNHVSFDEHEQVVFCHDKESGLRAIIAIHNTNLGPAVGGCRMWNYQSDDEALTDVLRLSRGMTYKNALAGLAMGGGKSVIIADPKTENREQLFRAFGRFVHSLGGRYYSAEDVGTTPADIMIAHDETPYVLGLEGMSGDPSPFTAMGTYLGIKAAVKHKLDKDSLKGLKIAVQGVGHVGYYLCKHLHEEGAELFVTDIHQASLDKVATDFGAAVVAPQDIYALDVDVYAPCALGATLNDTTLPQLKAGIVAGCANNQLAEPRHGEQLKQMGILYAPDYVINAGGIINVSFEKDYDAAKSTAKVEEIYNTLLSIFKQADEQNRTTAEVADEMARAIINGTQA
ncbi:MULTISPECIES: Glu/Leu/Phe/Val dehydrogenase dimerization domain-containing protein [Shewanella]|uniref:Glu/Leu/Phe/Val dehydrogenase dimerization domain-containing protein n=1 Tax=Shewanella TaxID=22 RepID=UPI001186BA80|nr:MULTISPECIES: Glu/Leu/Phe/Val dehydrogenase dimerization domain-containing protein [Shewanella]NDO72800.1 Glu/Leu/Phe/Val dehydrogenase [Shewanella sp. SE1]QWL04061.1 Glu/Leu/Phe/Val dehydrogenase [Shewanella indica]TVP14058.1 amino acid dehydrogenase [Shewanella sp. MSW]BCV36327.1 leucine dehydrogenase [Shewanella chilikensis]